MKKIILIAMCLVALTACKENTPKTDNSATLQRDSLQRILSQKDTELNDIMGTFNDIQEGFRQINEAQGRVDLENANPEKKSSADIIENINFIKRTMQLNRELIARLRQQLKSSSFNASKLEQTIDDLSKQLEEKSKEVAQLQAQLSDKDATIAQQGAQITSLNTNVSSLTAENESKSQTVAQQDRQLNTAWYVFGTKKELREQGILQGSSVLRSNTFNKDYFTKVDIRVDKIVKLYSRSAKLLTSHPADSYSLDRDAKGQYTLRITNPNTFWSVSRYLVIIVK